MKLIKIKEDHYVIVDHSEIREGDWCYDIALGIFQASHNYNAYNTNLCKKITHSTQPIEEFIDNEGIKRIGWTNIKVLELSEVKELIGEVDMEKKAREIVINNNPFGSENFSMSTFNGLVKDITKALEDNKDKKYTEEDLRKALWDLGDVLFNNNQNGIKEGEPQMYINNIIQSLQPKTHWEVEIVDGKLKLV